tara:strand:- start:6804 stop:7904 length:1101 start_codon:yes stop_codon:yes gene_type:complete
MPRYIIPKGAYDQTQGSKFESSTVNFKVMVFYDQKRDGVCEDFAQNSNDALNDLSDLGVYIDVGRPLRIDQTSTGGSNVDPVLTVYSAGSVADPTASGATVEVPMVCEGWSARESKQAKMWEFSAVYKAVSYENPGHVSAKISSRPRTTPAWRIGDTLVIQWSQSPIVPAGCTLPYNDVVQMGDIGGISYDINTQPRNYTVEGLQATFSFVIRAPYYATQQATELTVDPLWTEWTEGPSARTPGKRSCDDEWDEVTAETWPRGEWIVESVQITPINTVDHKVTVTMRTDDFQLCDQIPAQAYGGPVIPKVRPDQPTLSPPIPDVTEFLLCAEYVFWVNPYPMQREVFTAAEFPYKVYEYISESFQQ